MCSFDCRKESWFRLKRSSGKSHSRQQVLFEKKTKREFQEFHLNHIFLSRIKKQCWPMLKFTQAFSGFFLHSVPIFAFCIDGKRSSAAVAKEGREEIFVWVSRKTNINLSKGTTVEDCEVWRCGRPSCCWPQQLRPNLKVRHFSFQNHWFIDIFSSISGWRRSASTRNWVETSDWSEPTCSKWCHRRRKWGRWRVVLSSAGSFAASANDFSAWKEYINIINIKDCFHNSMLLS